MKRKALAVTVVLALLFSAVGTQIVNIGEAFPPYNSNLESSIIVSVSSPENNKLYNTTALKLNFNVTVGETTANSLISNVSYETDWQKKNSIVFSFDGYLLREAIDQLVDPRTLTDPISKLSTTVNFTGIPEGNHTIVIYTTMWHYSHIEKRFAAIEDYFQYTDLTMANISTTVSFAIDTAPPIISILSTKDQQYKTSDVPLNFTVNEAVSKITYSLDGKGNATIAGNATLTKLGNGYHNVTVYATDAAGNVGASETIYFSVEIPFPTILVIAPIATVAVIGVGLLIYFKKRKR